LLKTIQTQPIAFDQGTAVLSLDADLLWSQGDSPDRHLFAERYPNALPCYEHVLRNLVSSGISATWLVVGGMALSSSAGARDFRMAGLPRNLTRRIPAGNELTEPLWYRRTFIRQLALARVAQDIGLHGGLTGLVWTDGSSTCEVARCEFEAGVKALGELGISPTAFSFPRDRERHYSLLMEQGIRCFRGRAPVFSEKLGGSVPSALLRLMSEVGSSAPPPVWPEQRLPGLWNVPASMYLYPVGVPGSHFVSHESRMARIQKGIDAAARHKGVFHFSLRPVDLAEAPDGYRLFDEILDRLAGARQKGDVRIQNMTQLAGHMDFMAEHAGIPSTDASRLSGQIVNAGQY